MDSIKDMLWFLYNFVVIFAFLALFGLALAVAKLFSKRTQNRLLVLFIGYLVGGVAVASQGGTTTATITLLAGGALAAGVGFAALFKLVSRGRRV